MDYKKISNILAVIGNDALEFIDSNYLPNDFFTEFQDVLDFANYVSEGWAEVTEVSKEALELVWRVLCEYRNLDFEVMYDGIEEFFSAQIVNEG